MPTELPTPKQTRLDYWLSTTGEGLLYVLEALLFSRAAIAAIALRNYFLYEYRLPWHVEIIAYDLFRIGPSVIAWMVFVISAAIGFPYWLCVRRSGLFDAVRVARRIQWGGICLLLGTLLYPLRLIG
jgi:hypothetical protein